MDGSLKRIIESGKAVYFRSFHLTGKLAEGVEALPEVKRKLLNIEQISPEARERAIERLAQVLEQTK